MCSLVWLDLGLALTGVWFESGLVWLLVRMSKVLSVFGSGGMYGRGRSKEEEKVEEEEKEGRKEKKRRNGRYRNGTGIGIGIGL